MLELELELEADHRRHAIVEQSIAELKSAGLAHLPSGKFMANAAWLALAVMAHNLGRAVGQLAGPDLDTATAADALMSAKACGAGGSDGSGTVLVRMASAFFTYYALAPVLTHRACFSVTARMNPAVLKAISTIFEDAWTRDPLPPGGLGRPGTTLDQRRRGRRGPVHRLHQQAQGRARARPARRAPRQAAATRTARAVGGEQSELFAAYRHHAFFTNSSHDTVTADAIYRAHAISNRSWPT